MSAPLTKQRLAELDGLRGFALVMILAFHSIYQEGEFPAGSFFAWLQRFVAMDWTALDLFFVLSGFLIGGILMDSRESPNYFKTFTPAVFFASSRCTTPGFFFTSCSSVLPVLRSLASPTSVFILR
jgi:peptidoglycan/LPS O-acetylase OafA/YrhL